MRGRSISSSSDRPGEGVAGPASPPPALLLAILYGGTAALALVWLLVPHARQADDAGIVAVVAICAGVAAALLALRDRLPSRLFSPLLAAATLLVSGAIYASGEPGSAFALLYLPIVVYAVNWLVLRWALAQLLLASASYAAVLWVQDNGGAPGSEDVARWALLMGAMALLAVVVSLLRASLARQLVERTLAERQRDEATAMLDTLFEQAPVGLGFLDRDLRYRRLNRALAEVDGLSVEEHVGRTVPEVLPGAGEDLERRFRGVLADGHAESGAEVVMESPEQPGVRRHWLATYYPVRGRSREPLGVGTVLVDITDRKRAEEEAQSMRRLYESIFTSAGEGILALDRRGQVTAANPTALEMLGYTAGELLGCRMHPTLHHSRPDGSPYPEEECPISAVLADGEPRTARRAEAFWRSDGTSFPVEYVGAPIGSNGTAPSGAVVIFKDVSDRKEAEAQLVAAAFELESRAAELERSNAELEQFAYVASHDLSEPLRMISGFTQLLEQRYRDRLDDDADEFIGYIVDGVERMQALINALLQYSRVGRRAWAREDVDVGELVEGTLRSLGPAIEDAGATVEVGRLPVVPADPVGLGQVFQNLVANAIKFHGAEPPRVRISGSRLHAGWRFDVEDNGIGIEARHAERIFKMFQRLHGREAYSGTGIGLAICRKIVERHGGRIWVEPVDGGGSRFVFTINADRDEAAA